MEGGLLPSKVLKCAATLLAVPGVQIEAKS